MPARKLDFYLGADDALRAFSRAARRLGQLQEVLVAHVPAELRDSLRVKQLRDGTLTLKAANAAVATRVKQLSPRLLAACLERGSQVTAIKVEVQVDLLSPNARPAPAARRLSIETIDKIQRLAEQMEASPLQEALRRLARHGRERG